jgi:Putative transposase/Transposase zinc-binding domain
VTRPTLAQVLEQQAPAYLAAHAARMPSWHLTALDRLRRCGTEAAGRVFYQCPQCEDWLMAPASCGHRACNACGHHKALAWEAQQAARLLPVNYGLVTFTLPSEFRSLFKSNQRLCYDLLYQESARTLQTLAADPRHLGGEIGLTGVLHTWKRDLGYHPHVHYIVPAGAWKDGRWSDALRSQDGSDWFLPVRALATLMRNRMMKALRLHLSDAQRHTLPAAVWRKRWNVQIQPVGKGDKALSYLSRYVQKTAISKSTLIASDPRQVTISYIHRDSGARRTATFSGQEWMRRFLQHVLPTGFTRVRHFGFLSYAAKRTYAAIRAALAGRRSVLTAPEPSEQNRVSDPSPTAAHPPAPPQRYCCARCHVVMKFGAFWPAHKAGRGPPGYAPKPGAAVQRSLGLPLTA